MKKYILFALLIACSTLKGQVVFRHLTSINNTLGHTTRLDHPQLNGNPTAIIFIMPSLNSGGGTNPIGVDYTQNAAVSYNGSRWTIVNENTAVPMPPNVTFNVLIAPVNNPNYFTTTKSITNSVNVANGFAIDHPATNNKPNVLLLVTQNMESITNDAPPILSYGNGKWNIGNTRYMEYYRDNSQTQGLMKLGSRFNVMAIENNVVPGFSNASAFKHIASLENTVQVEPKHITFLDRPGVNNNQNVIIFATNYWGHGDAERESDPTKAGGPYNESSILVCFDHPNDQWRHNDNYWSIHNAIARPIPNGAKFHIVAVNIQNDNLSNFNNWDFETGDLRGWVKDGNAFDNQPTYGSIGFNRSGIAWSRNVPLGGDYWQNLTPEMEWSNGRHGNYWIGTSDNHLTPQVPYTNLQGDAPVGKLFSQEFRLNSKYISFLMGGKSTSNGLCKVELLCFDDGRIPKTTRVLVGTDISRFGKKLPIFQTTILPTRNIDGQTYIVLQTISSNQIAPPGTYADLNNGFFSRKYFQLPDSLNNRRARIAIVDDDINGHINVDDFRFENELSPSPIDNTVTPLWGMVDMHTHPMSHLGFGRKIMHGQPDNPSNQSDIASALGSCNATHGGWGIDNTGGNYIRMAIVHIMDEHNPYNADLDHNHSGFPLYPNHASMAHQQMWHEWIERAFKGGLRVIVALAVNNSLMAEAVDGDEGYKKDKESADRQLDEMVAFVNRHPFMRIAKSASELRQIVSQGKLAVILGVELDNFGDFNDPTKIVNENTVRYEIHRLFFEKSVRYIFPIHFADTKFGGCALYQPSQLSNLANHFTRSFVNINLTPPEIIANIPGLKYQVERAPDTRITYRLTNPFIPISGTGHDQPFAANAILLGLRGILEALESTPNPCAGALIDPRVIPCVSANINPFCPDLRCVLASYSDY